MGCNLELGLQPFTPSISSTSSTLSIGSNNETMSSKLEQMTIFYNGKICVCDVTELQAKFIIDHASRRSAERMSKCSANRANPTIISSPLPTAQRQQQLLCLNSDRTMKRSLQQFIQKRQHRIKATSPYHRH